MEFPKITSAQLNVTDNCNCACVYCFVKQQPNYITLQTAKDSVDFLINNAKGTNRVPHINFFGGEPTLMWDSIIVPTVEYGLSKCPNFNFSMTTNGVLLTEDKLQFLKQNNMGLLFSIDGDKETQDMNRPLKNGDSSFDILKENIPNIIKYYPDVAFRSTVTPESCHNLYKNILFAESQGFKTMFPIPNSFVHWSNEELNILREQMDLYAQHYIECMSNNITPIILPKVESQFPLILKRNYAIKENKNLRATSCEKCGIGAREAAAIGYNGLIYSCQELCTNVDKNSIFCLGDIYNGVDDSKRLSLCQTFDQGIIGDSCAKCKLYRVCDGGCSIHNYFVNKDIRKTIPIACEWSIILFDTAVKIMNTLGNSQNEMFKDRWEMNTSGRK